MLSKEKEKLLRTRSNYESDLKINNLSKTGIKKRCAFHEIKDHHSMENLFGVLKPKYHFVTHYPRVLLQNGPCVNFGSMRFESFHSKIITTAQSTASSKNSLKTIAVKQELIMCKLFDSMKIDLKDDFKLCSRDDSDCEAKPYFYTF
ncbi:hypothetical protein TSAR_006891, partial [Trichomalopsis sarcophagae]